MMQSHIWSVYFICNHMILDLARVEISDKPSVEESYSESTKKDVNVLEAKDGSHDTSVTRVNDFVQQV